MSTQGERTAETRRALLTAARQLFAEHGYAHTPTEEIVRRAGVTRGALYHHFANKEGLFRAVFEELEYELDDHVMEAIRRRSDLWERALAGFDGFLDDCLRPEIKQIVILDGPSVLGWKEWQEIDGRHALSQIEGGLKVLMDEGLIPVQPARPLAYLLHGAVNEAAMFMATADDVAAARGEIGASLRRLLEGLRSSETEER